MSASTDRAAERTGHAPLVSAVDLAVTFKGRRTGLHRQRIHAVKGVSLEIGRGETFGLLGESGSGKSTLGRLLLQLVRADRGVIRFDGRDLAGLSRAEQRQLRRRMQMVFQDPYASFDPSVPLLDSLLEPLAVHERMGRAQARERIDEVVTAVGLTARHLEQRPSQLSGGQLQRLAIARALTTHPDLLVLDEPVSALDMSTQAQILNLLMELQRERGLTYLLISHNPAVVRHVSRRIGVMYLGDLVEVGDAEQVHSDPRHPYTQALMGAVLTGDPTHVRPPRAARSA